MPREKVKAIEILAPARNIDYAKAAILCGADSIYIGSPKFSMRKSANNSLESIKKLVEFAHKYWVKVYITLNSTLFSAEEMQETQNIINELYEMQVDGIIIQELGILELDLPPIPIFLSTTTRCFTKEDVKFFEKCGISRIVLPRELTFDEMKDITENTNVEIEAFCYGFLCAGISGNCYLNYVENLRKMGSSEKAHCFASNYGICSARCMGAWTLYDADGNIIRENERLLNMRFLNLYDKVADLIDIGIDSFKIEGRERDMKYIKNATAMFSDLADKIAKEKNIKRLSSGKCIRSFEPAFHKNFNKNFTELYFNGRQKIVYTNYDLVGQNVGRVCDFKDNSFALDSDTELNVGDKLRYRKGENPVETIKITDVQNGRYFTEPTDTDINGLELYRYFDTKAFKEVEESVNYRVIPVSLNIIDNGNTYTVTATDSDSNKIQMNYPKGNNKTTKEDLYRLDTDCEFVAENMSSEIYLDDKEDFLNSVFSLLRAEREKNRPRVTKQITKTQHKYYKDEITYLNNVTNDYTKAFWQRHGVKNIEYSFETLDDIKDKKAFSAKYCIKYEIAMCTKDNPDNVPPLPWTIRQMESGNKFRIEFDCQNCLMYFYNID